jgi:O-antigen ligase
VSSIEIVERSDTVDPITGEDVIVYQLTATGNFADPNDLCTILVVATVISLYRLFDGGAGYFRVVWAAPVGLFFYALILTKSRGGLISLLVSLAVLTVSRLGWKRAVPLSAVLIAGILMTSGGRQTRFGTGEDTAQGRIQLWVEGLHLMARSPLTGIGASQYAEEVGLVAHNSFLHANVELGLLGGTCFVGAFYLPLWSLRRINTAGAEVIDPALRRLRPYLVALVAGYAAGLCSISRCYVVPTYMIVGLAAAYLRLVPVNRPEVVPWLNGRLVARLVAADLAVMTSIYVFIKLTVSY